MQKCKEMTKRELAHSWSFFYVFIGRQPDSEMQRSGIDLAKRAKAANLDAIHDTVHEMAKDEARHGKAFEGLLKRYFG